MTIEEAKEFIQDIANGMGSMTMEYWSEKTGDKLREALYVLEQGPILDEIRADICKSKTEHEMQIAESDIKAKLLISDIYCDIVNIIDKYKTESGV